MYSKTVFKNTFLAQFKNFPFIWGSVLFLLGLLIYTLEAHTAIGIGIRHTFRRHKASFALL
jgi:hypothetical protein